MDQRLADFWNNACLTAGHTGYGDPLLHRYDQPVRLATVDRILGLLFPLGLLGKAALDIGCGTGDFIALLRSHNATVTGLDISPRVIDVTRQRFAGNDKVTLLCGPVVDAALPPASFDLVTSVTVLQHIVDDDELIRSLRTVRRALKPDGRMILLELAPPHAAPVAEVLGGTSYLLERPPHIWHEAFAKVGLTVLDEPVMPQLGISLLRGLGWGIVAIRRLCRSSKGRQELGGTGGQRGVEEKQLSTARRIRRAGVAVMRRMLLTGAWPFDHFFRVPLPPRRWRHYRVFVLGIAR